jgi:hypothetical protein
MCLATRERRLASALSDHDSQLRGRTAKSKLTKTSNYNCRPGRAGGTPHGLVPIRRPEPGAWPPSRPKRS